MESIDDGAGGASRQVTAMQEELAPAVASVMEDMLARVANATANVPPVVASVKAHDPEPEVYDPTPVIRGYFVTSDAAASREEPQVTVRAQVPPESNAEQRRETVPSGAIAIEAMTETRDRPALSQEQPTKSDVVVVKDAPATVSVPETVTTEAANAKPATVAQPAPNADDPLKAKVRETWSLMFSSRYEDEEPTEEAVNRVERPTHAKTKTPSSLRAKLDRERRLDEQIQGSRHSKSEQPTRNKADPPPTPTTASRRRPKPAGWLKEDRPFEDAGLVTTAVRFCMEKAMLQAIQSLAELHAIAQNEPAPAKGDVALGVFLTQWELDRILRDAASLHLENPEYAPLPFETLLQVSWFLPLDDFERLRALVAEISRKRLSEGNVARLNDALHRHFVLRPHPGVRMQHLLLRIVDALVPPKNNNVLVSEEENQQEELVGELLHALYIRAAVPCPSLSAFMQLPPFELQRQFQLSSVLSIQRLVFFRFFLEALATQKANQPTGTNAWWPRSVGKPSRLQERRKSEAVSEISTPARSTSKRKIKKVKPQSPKSSDAPDKRTDAGSDRPVGWSTIATHGSAASPRSESPVSLLKAEEEKESPVAAFARHNDALSAALTALVRANPWLVDDVTTPTESPTATAMRASFLAAETFQQSLLLMAPAAVPPSMLVKMEEFTAILHTLAERSVPEEPKTEPPPTYAQATTPESAPQKPPPRVVQRANSTSFPPPYVSTSPAYWAFTPKIPEPATPNASIPRSVSKRAASPGFGDYDVRRSEKLTFEQRAGHSFAKGGLSVVEETAKKKTPAKREGPKKQSRMTDSASVASLEPPAYTHWASAAEKTTTDDDDERIETQVRDALRLQQSFVLDDLVHSLLHRGEPVKRAPAERPQSAKAATRSENVRPATSRVVSRVRTIATARGVETPIERKEKPRPTKHRQPDSPELKQPPRDYEPPVDDAHLQWAARVSEFYKAKLKAAVGCAGGS